MYAAYSIPKQLRKYTHVSLHLTVLLRKFMEFYKNVWKLKYVDDTSHDIFFTLIYITCLLFLINHLARSRHFVAKIPFLL